MGNYRDFYTWLHEQCMNFNISPELQNKIDMCAEEIYANVTFYAYNGQIGDISVLMKKTKTSVVLVFIDNGMKYNPLEKPDPDITLPPEDRPLGGLGIFMVKEMADDIKYEYINNRNVLVLYFNID
jgi:anti-sigma regulatory factor (Ser/Thr protein kinase)